MNLKRASFMLVVGVALLSVAFGFSGKAPVANATEITSWTDGKPQLTLQSEVSLSRLGSTNPLTCNVMPMKVVRFYINELFTDTKSLCMESFGAGLLDGNASIFQPQGSSKAYPMEDNFPKSGYLVPVPLSPSAMYVQSDPAYQGVNVGLYKDLYSHFTLDNSFLLPKFKLSGPDLMFKNADGRNMNFLSAGSVSANGMYWVGESLQYGFVRVNLTTLQMTTFANRNINKASDSYNDAEIQASPSGKYAAISYNQPMPNGARYLKIVDVDSCGKASGVFDDRTSTCKAVDYWPILKNQIPGLATITHIQFNTDNTLSFVAAVSQNGAIHRYLYHMTPTGQSERLEDYLAMGDSFASGEGAFDYIPSSDTGLNKCHQSVHSYPYLMAGIVGSSNSVACSGALTRNILGNSRLQKNNQLKDTLDKDISSDQLNTAQSQHIPGVIKQLDFVTKDNPQAVTISIGGNDVGFTDIIKRCIVPFNNFSSTSQNCYQTYEDRKELVDLINDQYPELVKTYTDLKAGDSTRRVYIVGYPQVVSPDGSCAVNVRMSESDRLFASLLTSYLDSVIQRAAAEAGVFYVDTQQAFDGHKLCEDGTKAVNGLTAGNDTWYKSANESYHPNKLGHELLAGTILAQTSNLTAAMPESQTIPAPNEDALAILQAPRTGRIVYDIINGGQDVVYVASGGMINLYDGSFTRILKAPQNMLAVLHSTPVILGTVPVDEDGTLNGTLKIPAGTPPGFHTLHLYGQNIFGNPVDIQKTVYVEASANDYDGDGVLNNKDSCPGIPQSGQDYDGDGIDDACDLDIGPAPIQPPSGNDQSGQSGDTSGSDSPDDGQTTTPPSETNRTGKGAAAQTTSLSSTQQSTGVTFIFKNTTLPTPQPQSVAAGTFLSHVKGATTNASTLAGKPKIPFAISNKPPLDKTKSNKQTGSEFVYVIALIVLVIIANLAGRYVIKRAATRH